MDIDSQRFVTCDQNVDSQIEFVPINQQGVSDVLADDRGFIHIDVINIINDVNTFTLARIRRFNDPDIFLALMLLQLLVMIVEISELFRKNVSVWR